MIFSSKPNNSPANQDSQPVATYMIAEPDIAVSRSPQPNDKEQASVISAGAVLQGSLISPSPVFFHGAITGEVEVPVITIGLAGVVKGSLQCDKATIDGRFDGDLRGTELILGAKADLNGTVKCRTLSVAKGALIFGDLNVGDYSE